MSAVEYDRGAWSGLLHALYDLLCAMPELVPSSAPFSARRLPATRTAEGKRAFCLMLSGVEDEDTGRQWQQSYEQHAVEVRVLSRISQTGGWVDDLATHLDACQAIRDAVLDRGDDGTGQQSPLAGWGPRWADVTHEEAGEFLVGIVRFGIRGVSSPAARLSAGRAA